MLFLFMDGCKCVMLTIHKFNKKKTDTVLVGRSRQVSIGEMFGNECIDVSGGFVCFYISMKVAPKHVAFRMVTVSLLSVHRPSGFNGAPNEQPFLQFFRRQRHWNSRR